MSDSPFAPFADPLNDVLAQNWWAIAVRGVFGILFGIVAFFFTGVTILSIVLVFVAYLLSTVSSRSSLQSARRSGTIGGAC